MKHVLLLVCVVCGSLAGCAGAQSAADRGAGSLALPVAIAGGTVTESRVAFTIAGGFTAATMLTLPIAQPTLRLHTSATGAELDALELPLGDVDVSALALPPDGLALRDLVLTAGPARAVVLQSDADALALRATVPLTLHWSLQLGDGSRHPLGTLATGPLELEVQIARDAGRTTATLQAACAGTCWTLDGVARLSDGAVYLAADAEVTAAE